jgi:hypothetical protein
LTKNERQQQGVTAAAHGAYFGDGVYTADNPFAFSNYGDIGLICARLCGTTKRVIAQCATNTDPAIHCLTGNKVVSSTTALHFADEVVLQSSSQIIPMLQFEKQAIISDPGAAMSSLSLRQNGSWRDNATHTVMEEYIATLRNIINSTFNGSPVQNHGRTIGPGRSPLSTPSAQTSVQQSLLNALTTHSLQSGFSVASVFNPGMAPPFLLQGDHCLLLLRRLLCSNRPSVYRRTTACNRVLMALASLIQEWLHLFRLQGDHCLLLYADCCAVTDPQCTDEPKLAIGLQWR